MMTAALLALQTIILPFSPSPSPEFNIFLQTDRSTVQPFDPPTHDEVVQTVSKVIKESQTNETDYKIKTVVIDPGHGGHDPGCSGASTREKHLALAVGLKVASAIEQQFPEVKVIMTRETDIFIPLHERAEIANRNSADLFISIHCNYMPGSKATKGSETYVMGLHTAEQNLEVAKRENSAILLEENYEQNYDFDPNSPEGHIMLSMFQNAYLEQSILFAERVEANIHSYAERKSRGVKQAGFYVLKATTMPSVLVETGFLSNRDEENYLNTDEGQSSMANAILLAFAEYKSVVETGNINTQPIAINLPPPTKEPTVVQVAEQRPPNHYQRQDLQARTPASTKVETEPKVISINDYRAVNQSPKGNMPTIVQFCIQLAAATQPVDANENKWQGLSYPIEVVKEGAYFKYQARGFKDLDEALRAKKQLQTQGFKDAFLVAYKNGEKISIDEAKKELGIRY